MSQPQRNNVKYYLHELAGLLRTSTIYLINIQQRNVLDHYKYLRMSWYDMCTSICIIHTPMHVNILAYTYTYVHIHLHAHTCIFIHEHKYQECVENCSDDKVPYICLSNFYQIFCNLDYNSENSVFS